MLTNFLGRSWPAYRVLLQRSPWPILVGPFHGEVGFEAMYWILFVQALGIDPKRLIPITRGGAAVWYGTPEGVELYGLREPKDLRIENMLQHARTGKLKQEQFTAFDRAIIRDAATALKLRRYHVLHPAWMYAVLAPFWEGRQGLDWLWPRVTQRVVHDGKPGRVLQVLRAPDLPAGVVLPPNFVAGRFYFRATYPRADVTLQLATECIKQVARNQPVVLLNPGVHADEHVDLDVTGIPNVVRLKDLCEVTPQTNLALQSAVIAKAAGFVGTYGGLAQLALRLGRPSVSYYLNWQGTMLAHKFLSEAMSVQTGISFLVMRIADIPLLHAVVPQVAFSGPSSGTVQQAEQVSTQAAADHHVESVSNV